MEKQIIFPPCCDSGSHLWLPPCAPWIYQPGLDIVSSEQSQPWTFWQRTKGFGKPLCWWKVHEFTTNKGGNYGQLCKSVNILCIFCHPTLKTKAKLKHIFLCGQIPENVMLKIIIPNQGFHRFETNFKPHVWCFNPHGLVVTTGNHR